MSFELLISFSFIVILGAMLPGPNWLLITTNAVTYGKKTAFITILGTLTAFYAHGLFSIIGISALIFSSAKAFSILKLAGVIYLAYLGISLLFQAFNERKTDAASKVNVKMSSKPNHHAYSQGLITNLLNPKVSMFYLALFPQFLTGTSSIIATTIFLVSIQVLIVGIWYSSVVIVTLKIGGKGSPKILRCVKGIMGAMMLYFGFNLAQTQIRT